jgi:hypothetical protein
VGSIPDGFKPKMSMAAIKETQRTRGSLESVSLTCFFIQFVFNQVYIRGKKQVQTKDYEIHIFASSLTTHLSGERAKTGWLGISIMCPSRETCLSLLFNANSAIIQLCHGENKLIVNEIMTRSAL